MWIIVKAWATRKCSRKDNLATHDKKLPHSGGGHSRSRYLVEEPTERPSTLVQFCLSGVVCCKSWCLCVRVALVGFYVADDGYAQQGRVWSGTGFVPMANLPDSDEDEEAEEAGKDNHSGLLL